MTDVAPPPAFMTDSDVLPKPHGATQRKPEHCRQAWIHRFLEKVVLPPCEVRGIDQASSTQANIGSRMMAIGRGCKPGTQDHWVFQNHPFVVSAFEIKHETKARDAQKSTAKLLRAAGVHVHEDIRWCREVLRGLRADGVRITANADYQAIHYDAQIEGGLREIEARKTAPRKASKRQEPRPSQSAVRRWNKGLLGRLGI